MKEFIISMFSSIQIENENLFIEAANISEKCFLSHLEWIEIDFIPHHRKGKLIIYTDDPDEFVINFRRSQFDKIQEVYSLMFPYIKRITVNDEKRQLTIFNKGNADNTYRSSLKINKSTPYTYVDYNDIIDYKVIINGELIQNPKQFLSGNPNLACGSLVSLKNGPYIKQLDIMLIINSIEIPSIDIKYITRSTKVDSKYAQYLYKLMSNDLSILTQIINANNKQNIFSNNHLDKLPVEQLKQLKELLDSGIITQEEFDAKKKQLLEL